MNEAAPISAQGAGIGRSGRVAVWLKARRAEAWPVIAVVIALLALWYAACVPMNAAQSVTDAARADIAVTPDSARDRRGMSGLALAFANPQVASARAFSQDRPRLPAPHQVAAELWRTTAGEPIGSNRSLLTHAWVTLSATLTGFVIGTGLGILLAIGIVHSRVMDMSVLPWAIVSQTVPIIAIAPMIIVVLYSVGVEGLLPKAIISAYLSFFPVVVGMVKGLRSPDAMQLDLLRTYAANRTETFLKLRLPASAPYLFASLKIGIAASLVGAIGSALFAAAILAALAVAIVGWIERIVLDRMGLRQ